MMGWDGPITHRQYLGWCGWYNMSMDIPSRTDFYLMRQTQVIQQILAKNPERIKLADQKLVFSNDYSGGSRKKKSSLTPEQAAAISKAKWFMMFGGAKNIRGTEDSNITN